MRIHLPRRDRSDYAACGIHLPHRVKCDVFEIECGRCKRTRYFAELMRARRPQITVVTQKKPLSEHSQDHAFFWEHLNELQVFDATVLAWNSKHQLCRLTALNACSSERKIQLIGEFEARLWNVPVTPGQRVCFTAYCSQRWEEPQGRIPFLNFEQVIRVYAGKKKKKQKAGNWHWSEHARQRQAQRMIPDEVVNFVLKHGISWQEKKHRIFRMPDNWHDFPKVKPWRKLQVITEGETIITLFLCWKPIPKQYLKQGPGLS